MISNAETINTKKPRSDPSPKQSGLRRGFIFLFSITDSLSLSPQETVPLNLSSSLTVPLVLLIQIIPDFIDSEKQEDDSKRGSNETNQKEYNRYTDGYADSRDQDGYDAIFLQVFVWFHGCRSAPPGSAPGKHLLILSHILSPDWYLSES